MNPIVEQFMSIQGEGATIGSPAYFIRLAGCNLSCKWCDSKNASRQPLKSQINIKDVSIPEYANRLIITGGEPLLYNLYSFIRNIKEKNQNLKIIEVETNGVLVPTSSVFDYVNQWNISPKLCDTQNLNIHQSIALQNIGTWALKAKDYSKVIFKFVIGNNEQMNQVLTLLNTFPIPRDKVYIMQQGIKRDQFLENKFNYELIEMCKKHGLKYSTRLHIVLWDKQTGV